MLCICFHLTLAIVSQNPKTKNSWRKPKKQKKKRTWETGGLTALLSDIFLTNTENVYYVYIRFYKNRERETERERELWSFQEGKTSTSLNVCTGLHIWAPLNAILAWKKVTTGHHVLKPTDLLWDTNELMKFFSYPIRCAWTLRGSKMLSSWGLEMLRYPWN